MKTSYKRYFCYQKILVGIWGKMSLNEVIKFQFKKCDTSIIKFHSPFFNNSGSILFFLKLKFHWTKCRRNWAEKRIFKRYFFVSSYPRLMSVFSLCFPPIFLVYSGNLSYKKFTMVSQTVKFRVKLQTASFRWLALTTMNAKDAWRHRISCLF